METMKYLSQKTNSGTNLNKIPNVTGSAFWELLGPESIEELNGLTVTGGANGDLLQRTGTDTWANITPADMAEAGIAFTDLSDIDDENINNGDVLFRSGSTWQFVSLSTVSNDSTRGIDLSDLKNVAETAEASNGQVLQRTSTGWKYITLASAIADQTSGVGIADLNDIDAPTTDQNGHVLRGNHTVTGGVSSISYDWVDNEEATASIQEYVNTVDYLKGALIEEDGSLYIAVIANGPTHTVTAPGTDSTVWDLIGPEEIDELNDVTLTGVASGNLLRRNTANTGWENVTPAVMAGNDIRIRDLRGVPSVAVASGLLQRDPIGFGNNWVIQNPATIAKGGSTSASGIKVENLKDVSTTTGTDKQVLQTDGSDYAPVDVNDILDDGTLESIGNVSSALELNPSTTSNDLGKVLTVRSTGSGTTADPTLPSFVWEANTSSTVPGFNTGTATNPQTYVSGSLVTFNSQIWISLASLNSAVETNNTLPSPGTRNLPASAGGGPEWELVGPETITDLNDTIITSPVSSNVLRYDGTTWNNVTPATTAGDFDLKDIKDVSSDGVSANDFLKYDGSEWKHQQTLGNLNTVIDDVELDANLAEHDILRRDSNNEWVNTKLEDHIRDNVDIPLNHLSDVTTTGTTAGQVLEFTSGGWVGKSRGFDDTTPADETGNTVTLNRFDGRSIRSVATNNGIQTITFATEALTSANLVLDPVSYEWDLVTPSMSAEVTANNDILFQGDFLNTVDSINMVTGNSTQTLLSAVHTETSTFLENWSETFSLAPVDPRTGGFGTLIESTVTATLTDQNSANAKTVSQDVIWEQPTLTGVVRENLGVDSGGSVILTGDVVNTALSSSFLTPLNRTYLYSADVGNTSDSVNNTSIVLVKHDETFLATTGNNGGVNIVDGFYTFSRGNVFHTGETTSTGLFDIKFTKPGTTQTLDLSTNAIVNYTPTFPVFTGFTNQGSVPSIANVVAFTATNVNDNGTGFRREYSTITNSTGSDQTLWVAIRTTALSGTTPTFSTHNPGANPQVISNIITGNTRTLEPSSPPSGYVAEGYTLFGIPLVANGDSVIVTIS